MEHSSFATRSTPVWQFFGWSFLLSWLIWVPLTLAHFNLGPVRVSEQVSGLVRLLGVLIPALVGMTLTAHSGGRTKLRKLLLPVAFHLSFNIVNVAVFPVTSTIGAYALFIGLQGAGILGVILRIHRPEVLPEKA